MREETWEEREERERVEAESELAQEVLGLRIQGVMVELGDSGFRSIVLCLDNNKAIVFEPVNNWGDFPAVSWEDSEGMRGHGSGYM